MFHVSTSNGTVRYGTVRYGTVRYGTVRYGTVRYGRLSFACAGLTLWNALPAAFRNTGNSAHFKKILKTVLFSN